MTVNAITDTKKGRTGIAPTYLHTTRVCIFSGISSFKETSTPDNTHVMPVHTPVQNKHTSRKRGM